jgi:hypothetical protein
MSFTFAIDAFKLVIDAFKLVINAFIWVINASTLVIDNFDQEYFKDVVDKDFINY